MANKSNVVFFLLGDCKASEFYVPTFWNSPGIESRWGRDFPHPSRPTLGPTQLPIKWVPGLSQELKRSGSGTDHPHHLAPRIKEEYSCKSTPPLGLRGLF